MRTLEGNATGPPLRHGYVSLAGLFGTGLGCGGFRVVSGSGVVALKCR